MLIVNILFLYKRAVIVMEKAERCGLHRTYIGSIERGERNITLESLQTIADSLNKQPIDFLIEADDV